MAIREILKEGNPTLRKVCRDVEVFDDRLHQLLDDMHETMVDADGCGLAAPQIGILRNYVIMEIDNIYLELINPKIVKIEGEQIALESCLSVNGKGCMVKRPELVTVEYLDRFGTSQSSNFNGLFARCCCHELDHLMGILFIDREAKGNID